MAIEVMDLPSDGDELVSVTVCGSPRSVANCNAVHNDRYASEMADWGVFSFTRRPLQNRILISSLISIPLDSLAFLYLSGYLSPLSFTTETLSKAVGVLIVWMMLRARVKNAPASAA